MEFDYTVNEGEILAASAHEFGQRLSGIVQVIKESFVPVLTSHL